MIELKMCVIEEEFEKRIKIIMVATSCRVCAMNKWCN